ACGHTVRGRRSQQSGDSCSFPGVRGPLGVALAHAVCYPYRVARRSRRLPASPLKTLIHTPDAREHPDRSPTPGSSLTSARTVAARRGLGAVALGAVVYASLAAMPWDAIARAWADVGGSRGWLVAVGTIALGGTIAATRSLWRAARELSS